MEIVKLKVTSFTKRVFFSAFFCHFICWMQKTLWRPGSVRVGIPSQVSCDLWSPLWCVCPALSMLVNLFLSHTHTFPQYHITWEILTGKFKPVGERLSWGFERIFTPASASLLQAFNWKEIEKPKRGNQKVLGEANYKKHFHLFSFVVELNDLVYKMENEFY